MPVKEYLLEKIFPMFFPVLLGIGTSLVFTHFDVRSLDTRVAAIESSLGDRPVLIQEFRVLQSQFNNLEALQKQNHADVKEELDEIKDLIRTK